MDIQVLCQQVDKLAVAAWQHAIAMPDTLFVQRTERQLLHWQTRFQDKIGVDGKLCGALRAGSSVAM